MTNAAYSCDCVYYCWEYIIEHPGFESKVSQFMNKSTLRFMFFFSFFNRGLQPTEFWPSNQ